MKYRVKSVRVRQPINTMYVVQRKLWYWPFWVEVGGHFNRYFSEQEAYISMVKLKTTKQERKL